jgi:hypothetical protein
MPFILLNTTKVHRYQAALYEFILSAQTFIVNECYFIKNQGKYLIEPLFYPFESIQGDCFEINHLRIDPASHPKNALFLFNNHLRNFGLSLPQSHHEADCWVWPESFKLRFQFNSEKGLYFLSPSHPSLKIID